MAMTNPLRRYQSHKTVEAFKIVRIEVIPESQSALLFATDEPVGSMQSSMLVSAAFSAKHQPHVGGYFVRYADGYESFSPAEPFEDGYTLIEAPDAD